MGCSRLHDFNFFHALRRVLTLWAFTKHILADWIMH
jgi:hypothetical protein